MYKFIKGALVFTGGVTVGAGLITGLFLGSEDIRKVIKTKIISMLEA